MEKWRERERSLKERDWKEKKRVLEKRVLERERERESLSTPDSIGFLLKYPLTPVWLADFLCYYIHYLPVCSCSYVTIDTL